MLFGLLISTMAKKQIPRLDLLNWFSVTWCTNVVLAYRMLPGQPTVIGTYVGWTTRFYCTHSSRVDILLHSSVIFELLQLLQALQACRAPNWTSKVRQAGQGEWHIKHEWQTQFLMNKSHSSGHTQPIFCHLTEPDLSVYLPIPLLSVWALQLWLSPKLLLLLWTILLLVHKHFSILKRASGLSDFSKCIIFFSWTFSTCEF